MKYFIVFENTEPQEQSNQLVSALPFSFDQGNLEKVQSALVRSSTIPRVAFPLWFIWILRSNESATNLGHMLWHRNAGCVKTVTEMEIFCPQDKKEHSVLNFSSVYCLFTSGVTEKTVEVFMCC